MEAKMSSSNQSTPSYPEIISKADGLIVQVGTPGISADQARTLIRETIRKHLPRQWTATVLDPSGRMFAVSPSTRTGTIALSTAWEHARKLQALSDIDFAEVDVIVPGHDPLPVQVLDRRSISRGFSGGKQHKGCSKNHDWSLEKLNVPEAWKLRLPQGGKRFGEGIQIGHPDTGYTEHPDILNERLLISKGYDFEDDDPDPLDPLKGQSPGHGTSTASVIQSDWDDDIESTVSGTAPRAKLVPIRVSTSVIHLSFSKLVKALYKAIESDSHIVSMSLGGPFYSKALDKASTDAVENGLILIAAAGNHWPYVIYPAKLDQVIAVAATSCQDKPWKGSARGKSVDVSAPGESIWRAHSKGSGDYHVTRSHGTSYATANAAGIAALWLAFWGRDRLIRQYGVGNLATIYKSLLVKHGVRQPSSWDNKRYGAGIIDAMALLQTPLPNRAPARGFRFTARPANAPGTDELSEILDYFPGIPRSRMVSVLSKTLKVDEDDLPETLESYGAELRYHLACNPEVRHRLRAQASPQRHGIRGLSSTILLSDEQFKKQSSRSLRKLIGG